MPKFFDPDASGGVSVATGTSAPSQHSNRLTEQQQQIVDAVAQGVMPAVTETVNQAVAGLRSEVQQALERVDQSAATPAKPQQQAASLFGGTPNNPNVAPAQRQGEDPMSSRGFALHRAAGYADGLFEEQDCKNEIESSKWLAQAMGQMGFRRGAKRSMLVPIAQNYIPFQIMRDYRQKFGDIDQMLQQSVQGAGSDGAELLERVLTQRMGGMASAEDFAAMRQALSMFDDTGLSIFTRPGPKGEMISLLRSSEVLSRAGATQIQLPPNGYLPFGRQTGASTAYWVGEKQEITTSEPSTGELELRAKKLATRVQIPNELMMFGGPDVEAFMRADMILSMSLAVDLAGLEGSGGLHQPLGILNQSGIQTHTRSLTTATDGDQFNPETPGAMLADLGENEFDTEREASLKWVMRPKGWHDNILQRRSGSGYAADDGKGNWLFNVSADVAGGAPTRLRGKDVLLSTQVSNTRVKGSGTDLSYVLAGIFSNVIIARIGVVEFATSVEGDTVFATDQTGLRAIQHVDIGIKRPKAFVLADKIDWDLPA